MALLEIIHLTGDVERRDLYKRQPMTIGSHSSNDLRIDEEGVEVMHCRISWNKDCWEAVAAGTSPVELNGIPVQRASLKSGDTLRFGTVDVKFHGGVTVDDTPADTIGIKPTSDEAILATRPPTAPPKAVETKRTLPSASEKPASLRSDEALMQSLELLAYESKPGNTGSRKKAALDEEDNDTADEVSRTPVKASKPAPKKPEAVEGPEEDNTLLEEVKPKPSNTSGVTDRFKRAMGPPRRPGEMNTIRSPLVLGLTGFVVLTLLVAGTFYFIAGRRIAETEFEAAKMQITEEKYKSGIEALEDFIKHHPKHEKVLEAERLIGLSKVDQYIKSSAPNYVEAIKNIQAIAAELGDKPGFDELKPEIASRSGDSALGAAQQAGKNPKVGRSLLITSNDAKKLMISFSPKDSQPVERLAQIGSAYRGAENLIRKYEINNGITNEIKTALTAKNSMEALRLRRNLLAQYPDYAGDKAFRDLLNEAMEVERSLVKIESSETPASHEDGPVAPQAPRTLMFHARTGTDQVSVNEIVWVLGKDCLYGADTVTGMPIWRRVVGTDPAFFPIEESAMPSLIYFDSDQNELVRIKRSDGSLVWRQPIADRAAGEPLIDEGQIYLATTGGRLLKIDLDQGAIISTLTFSQSIRGPALIGNDLMVVVGDQDVAYTLSKRPLECMAVSYFGQKAQSVVAPLVSMGGYAAFIENLSEDSSAIHLLKQEGDKPQLVEAGVGAITGMVVDKPVIRGRDLFVPSTVERVSAFSVSDTPNEPPLTKGPTFQVQGAKGSPIYLTTGPERQVWMSSSALRRLQLTTDTIQADPNVAAIGLSSQPNQHQGAYLFNARRRPFTDAVTLTQTDRDTLTADWQLLAGARFLATSVFPGESPSLTLVNEGGATFRVTTAQLQSPGFQTESAIKLPINEETTQPLRACSLPDGQVVVVCGDPEPRIWLINRLGQVEKQGILPAPPQAAPAYLDKRILIPLAGKLHVARLGQGESVIQDYQFPIVEGEVPPVWKQVLSDGERSAIGLTEAGELLQFRLEPKPRPNLTEVSRLSLPSPAIGQLAWHQGSFAAACTTGEVLWFDASKLEPKGQRTMEVPPSGTAYITPAGILIETGREELHCLNLDSELTTQWTIKIDGTSLAGQPELVNDQLALCFESGLVRYVDPKTGATIAEHQVSGSLDSGPMSFGDSIFTTTWDGSLVALPLGAPTASADVSAPTETSN